MKTASLIILLVAALDAGYLCVWAFRRSMQWSSVVDNFGSDVGKSTVSTWHFDHVRSVEGDYDFVLVNAALIVVLLVVSSILFANRNGRT